MINIQDYDSHRPDVLEVLARFDGKNWLTSVVLYTVEGDAALTVEYITDWPLDRAYLGDSFRVNVSELEAITPGPNGSERLRYRVTPRQDYAAEVAGTASTRDVDPPCRCGDYACPQGAS